MLLREIGGEFAFLKRVIAPSGDNRVLVPNGDDAAVFRCGNEIWAVSTDTIVSGDHFSLKYFTPHQVGFKAIESSASDICAMGGYLKFVFLSLCVPRELPVDVLEGIYSGINSACERIGCSVLGGDTTHSEQLVVSVTVLGTIKEEQHIARRGDAEVGDSIFVSGPLGSSMAGLRLFQREVPGFDDVKRFHCEPRCRIDLVEALAPYVNAMIDISDGLSSEIHHICEASNCGAVIIEECVPILDEVREAAAALKEDPLKFAYSGGEDFQLLYTMPRQFISCAKGVRVGEIVKPSGVFVSREGKLFPLENRGYDHFL